MISKLNSKKRNTHILDFMEIKNFVLQWIPSRKLNNPQNGENFANHVLGKGLISRIKNFYNLTIKRLII